MKIISHRGYWQRESEKNSMTALARSLNVGFGIETDIRDYCGELVISHDIPRKSVLSFDKFLECSFDLCLEKNLTLALNIKSDGLAAKLSESLKKHSALDVFVFDMSIPDSRSYYSEDISVFTRMSEVEKPVWLDESAGVWLDSFYSEWYDLDIVENFLSSGKRVCLVSPELHGRDHIKFWEKVRDLSQYDNVLLCTDFPEDAIKYFEGTL
tara:strand:+ start:60 stop:692 length:633 start_codon:yes stop_codon:yes gene_type:complete